MEFYEGAPAFNFQISKKNLLAEFLQENFSHLTLLSLTLLNHLVSKV